MIGGHSRGCYRRSAAPMWRTHTLLVALTVTLVLLLAGDGADAATYSLSRPRMVRETLPYSGPDSAGRKYIEICRYSRAFLV